MFIILLIFCHAHEKCLQTTYSKQGGKCSLECSLQVQTL